jgi:hypothetical protein
VTSPFMGPMRPLANLPISSFMGPVRPVDYAGPTTQPTSPTDTGGGGALGVTTTGTDGSSLPVGPQRPPIRDPFRPPPRSPFTP